MQIADIIAAPWAITPEMFNEIQGIYARHCRGEQINLASLEAKIGAPLNNARQPMQIENGVAIISLEGVTAKRANLLLNISGGVSTQVLGQQFAQALADPNVKAIVLAVDSPGGTVDGTQALADQIFAARGKKPIVAVADGMCASAAYWIASACDKVYVENDTTMVGSIGIITTHLDQSARDMQAGIRVTEIKAGKYKQMGSSNAPLGMAETDALQAMVDQTYQVFLSAVARNRGEDLETVQQEMAEGRVFLGRTAIDAGLADGMATLDQTMADLGTPAPPLPSAAAPAIARAVAPAPRSVIAPAIVVAAAASPVALVAPPAATIKPMAASADNNWSGLTAEVLAASDPVLTLNEFGAYVMKDADIPTKDFNPAAVARSARAYVDEMWRLGIQISDIEAVQHVLSSQR